MSLLDIFFPPVCPLCEKDESASSSPLCHSCAGGFESKSIKGPLCTVCGIPFSSPAQASHVCGECLSKERPFVLARSAFLYDGTVMDAVHGLKYKGSVILASALGALAARAWSLERPDVAVPVPLHPERLKSRGFNQSLLIARRVARELSIGVDYSSLKRVRDTGQQTRLKSNERRENVRGAFGVVRPEVVEGKRVLLIDDVYTTGATINECAKALKKAGAEVYALTLARAVAL